MVNATRCATVLIEAIWPVDPAGAVARADVERRGGAGRRGDVDEPRRTQRPTRMLEGWAADVDALLDERARAARPPPRTLPSSCRSAAWWTWRAIPEVACSG